MWHRAVHGRTARGFESIRDVFEDNVAEVRDGGVAFAAVVGAEFVADLWAGAAGREPWRATTRAVIMSASKGVSATATAVVADRGLLDVDEPVSQYWPELASAGKEQLTAAHVLSHSAGVLTIPEYAELLDPYGRGSSETEEILRRLERVQPEWLPGSAHGYHGLTSGWLLDEIVRRTAGATIRAIVRGEIAAPLRLDLDIGTPTATQALVARVVVPIAAERELLRERVEDPASPFGRMLLAVDGHSLDRHGGRVLRRPAQPRARAAGRQRHRDGACSGDPVRRARERGVVRRASAHLEGDRPCVRGRTRARAPQGRGEREPLGARIRTSCSAAARAAARMGALRRIVRHLGFGGQITFADPNAGVGIGFVRSHFSFGSPLGSRLVEAFYAALN